MRNKNSRTMHKYVIGTAVALSAVFLGACGGGLEGRYFYGENDEGITVELRDENVAVVSISGLSSVQGTYSVEGNDVTVTMPDGDIDIFTIVDGNLTTRAFGEDMTFEKQ